MKQKGLTWLTVLLVIALAALSVFQYRTNQELSAQIR